MHLSLRATFSHSAWPFRRLFFMFLILVYACKPSKMERPLNEMMETDRAASRLAAKKGFNAALLEFADSGFVKLNDGAFPLIGKKAYADAVNGNAGTLTLSWEPVGGTVASSGELGYTWGNWKYVTRDSIYYGNYFTAWKLQPDGSWKMLLDGGNSTPPPTQ